MAHATIRATLIPEIVRMITEKFHISEEEAMDQYYTSRTAEALSDSETGLYGQSALFIFGLFCQEKAGRESKRVMKILFVCHGNICRSTMAQYVMQYLVDQRGLADAFYIDSAATSREEIGNRPHHGTQRKLREVGIPCGDHRAVQMTRQDYEKYDYLIGMDTWNIRNMTRIAGGDPEGKIHKLLDYTERKGDIADPWYTGDFDETYVDVREGCEALLAHILKEDLY